MRINGLWWTDEAMDEFWAQVDMSGGPETCWLWKGDWTCSGYGMASGRAIRRVSNAYWLAWVLAHRKTPKENQHLRHVCGLAPCCNPLHLEEGTPTENQADRYLHENQFRSLSAEQKDAIKADERHFNAIADAYQVAPVVIWRIKYGKPARRVVRSRA